jgi:hypothetical protein
MPKYALIHNIGGLTCLCHLLHLLHVDFQAILLNPPYIVYHLILPTTNNTKVGSCDARQSWARPKFQQNLPIKYCQTLLKLQLYIFMFIQSLQLVDSFPLLFHEELKQLNLN